MTYEEIEERFNHHHDEYLKFERIQKGDRLSNRPDICAFIYLDRLKPGKTSMIGSVGHGEIFLDFDEADCMKLTERDVIYLIRCGVRLSELGGLAMFA